ILCRNGRVTPAVIHDDLTAAPLVVPQVGVRRVQDAADLLVGEAHVAIEVKSRPVPTQILEHDELEDGVLDQVLEICRWGRGTEDPHLPVGCQFAAWQIAGKDLTARARVSRPLIDFLQSPDLRSVEAGVWRLVRLALKYRWVEVAAARVADHAVDEP